MNPDTLVQMAQKSFRVTLGATAFLLETLQDPQRRDVNVARLQTDFNQLTEEWEQKGETTEREARTFVDTFLSQQFNPNRAADIQPTGTTPASTSIVSTSPDIQQDLQELTTQLAELRAELERLRVQDS